MEEKINNKPHHVVSDFNRLFVWKRDLHPSLKFETDPLLRVLEGLNQV